MAKGIQQLRAGETPPAMARTLDFCGRRWALRVVWELKVGAMNFRALQSACGGISPSVLQRRVHELRELQIVEKIQGLGYRLTARGEGLFQVLIGLSKWAERQQIDRHVNDN